MKAMSIMLNKIFSKKPQSCVGIDFSSRFIRLLELEKNKYGYLVKHFAFCEIKDKNVTIHLKNLISDFSCRSQNSIFALPYSRIINKNIEISNSLKEGEIEKFLLLNMKEYIGCEADKIDMDYEIQKSEKAGSIKIEMSITKKEQTRKIIEMANHANLNPIIIDVNAFAFVRAVKIFTPWINQFAVLCVNINFDSILLVVQNQGKVIYLQEDLVVEDNTQSNANIIETLVNSIRFCFSQISLSVNKILLSGEKAFDKDILNVIKQQLNIDIAIINPFQQMLDNKNLIQSGISKFKCSNAEDPSSQSIAASFIVCAGLALRKFSYEEC